MSFYLYSISTGFYIKSGGYVGILNSNPQYPLDVSGDCRITGQTLFGVRPTVNGSGVLLQGEVTQGSNVVSHLLGTSDVQGGFMSYSTRDTNFQGLGSISVIGTDLAGIITIYVGGFASATNLVLDVYFNSPFLNFPFVIFSPGSTAAAMLPNTTCTCNRNPQGQPDGHAAFTLSSPGPLQEGNTYIWNYVVVGYQA